MLSPKSMTHSLTNKIAVVTGASRGIGRATALKLAKEGAEVFVHYSVSKESAEAVVAEIAKTGNKAKAIHADLSKVAGAVKLAEQIPGNIDILVNNAGVAEFVGLAETTEEQFDKQFNVNVKGLFFVTQKLAPKINDNGRIINLSSVVATRSFEGIPSYSATKGAVETLTIQLAGEFGKRGITVNAVAPGIIATDMAAPIVDNHGDSVSKAIQAIPRLGQPEDVADAIAALAGEGGRWITGQSIAVSGGTKI